MVPSFKRRAPSVMNHIGFMVGGAFFYQKLTKKSKEGKMTFNKNSKNAVKRLWGAAFNKNPKDQAILFAAGRDVEAVPPADEALIPYEIKADIAYVKALSDQKIIDKKTKKKLLTGLKELNQLYEEGKFKLDPLLEDTTTNIEAFLTKKYGIDIAGRLHSGRSRNDLAVTDCILFMKDTNELFKKEIKELISVLNKYAKKYAYVLVPAYTHFQQATVTTFGNMLDGFAKVLEKDLKRFKAWNEIEEENPLGSAAGYGSIFPISKEKITEYLGFKTWAKNEIQAVTFKGDAETMMVFNLSVLMNHLSTLAQTLMIFGMQQFGFITISEEYSTGSSIMPQKKNPDSLEVIKAKASMCHGYLMALLSLTKASFIGYNRDFQWVKYLVMDAVNEAIMVPKIMAGVIKTMKVNAKTMAKAATKGFILSQPIMESLAMEFNLPMRMAKIIIETTIKKCQVKGDFNLKVLNQVIKEFKLNFQVSQAQFKKWTDPMSVAKMQMKKDF